MLSVSVFMPIGSTELAGEFIDGSSGETREAPSHNKSRVSSVTC
jgi:hypothetical protein